MNTYNPSFNDIGNPFARIRSVKSLFDLSPLRDVERDHLKNVYALLTGGVACAGVGAYTHLMYGIGGNMTAILSLVTLVYLMFTRDPLSKDITKRGAAFAGFSFFQGASLGPLLSTMIEVDPSILVTALVATAAVFLCFSAAAVFSPRRSYLFLGGTLGSAALVMFVASLLNIAVQSTLLFNLQLYGGLLMFCGYVVFDTQLIVEKFSAGDRDLVWHAVELFIDLVAIFVRIAIILLRNAEKKKKQRK